jgi:hypothetical protein
MGRQNCKWSRCDFASTDQWEIWHPLRVRSAVLVVLALAAAFPAPAAYAGKYWSIEKVMRKIDGVRVRAGAKVVRIQSETTLCAGTGGSIRVRGVRRWARFACTFTTFSRGGVDRDVEFVVRVLGTKRFELRDVHWVGTSR